MKRINILITDPIDDEGIKILENAGFRVDVSPDIKPNELKRIVYNYNVIIVRSRTKVTKEIIDAAENLQIIARAGYGLENIDVAEAKKRGIRIIRSPTAPSDSVAELTVGLMISLAREIIRANSSMKEGHWIKRELLGEELKGKTIGIIGFGRIGSKVAKLAKAMGLKILITDPYRNPLLLKKLGAKKVSLKDLLRKSDVVTLHVPLNSHTYHMLGEEEFRLMKNGAYLINTSRGNVIDEEALLEALKAGKLAGVALDVYATEPPIETTLIKMPNVICTPHIGAQTKEAQRKAALIVAKKIVKALKERES